MKIKQYEDIYPLTIIQMRYGGKYVTSNTIAENKLIQDIQELEDYHYKSDKEIIEKFKSYGLECGIGKTIWESLDNLIENQDDENS